MGKQIEFRHSLKTTNFNEAKELCRLASVKADTEIKWARARMASMAKPEPPAPLTESEIFHLVSTWLIEQERRADQWAALEVPAYEPEEQEAALENLVGELMEFTKHNGSPTASRWCEKLVDDLLQSRPELQLKKGGKDYQRLSALLRRAQIEKLHRKIDRLEGGTMKPFDPAFQMLFAHSPTPEAPKSKMTLKQLTDKFMEHQRANNASTTPVTYAIPIRLLHEVLGKQKLVAEITRDDIIKVGEALRRIPAHVTQRYPKMPLLKAVAKADAEGNKVRFSPQTVSKYFNNVSAIFNFVEEDGVFTLNPVKGKRLREMFRVRSRSKRRLFTPDELKAIFNAPLYTGCEDDERRYNIPGPNKPRRARFWVPLLALFQGCRLNEICQLYCEDVQEKDGIAFLMVREELDDHEVTEKTLKTKSSIRQVPIHPEIMRMGFIEFVMLRRKDGKAARLFPELKLGKSSQRYSSIMSRWFARFATLACGYKPKAVFHSFRHHVRTALAEAGVGIEVVDEICGWDEGKRGMERRYLHLGLKHLADSVAKVKYVGLDLSHLYVTQEQAVSS